jgi:preprotein translocase SecE subunit
VIHKEVNNNVTGSQMHGQIGERAVLIATAGLAWVVASHLTALAGQGYSGTVLQGAQLAVVIGATICVRVLLRRTSAYEFIATTEDECRRIHWPHSDEVKSSVLVLLVSLLGIAVGTLLVDYTWKTIFTLVGFLTFT